MWRNALSRCAPVARDVARVAAAPFSSSVADAAVASALPDVGVVNRTISAFTKRSEWTQALSFLKDVRGQFLQPSIYTFGAALAVYDRGAKWQHGLGLLGEMRSIAMQPNTICFNSTISACASARQWAPAFSLLRSMAEAQAKADAISYNSAMKSCEALGTWQLAVVLLDEMQLSGVRPTRITFGTLTNACEKSSLWEHAILFLAEVSVHRLTADALCFSAAMSACARRRRWQSSLLLLVEMQASRVAPDLTALNVAISSCEKGSHWAGGLYWLSVAQRRHMKPDLISFNAAISACSKGDHWERAVSLLSSMDRHVVRPDHISFCAAVSSCERGAAWQPALKLLDTMKDYALQPDPVSCAAALDAVTAGLPVSARSDALEAALRHLNHALITTLERHGVAACRQEAATHAVSGIDALQRFGRLGEGLRNRFEEVVYTPALDRLRSLLEPKPTSDHDADRGQNGVVWDWLVGQRGTRLPPERGHWQDHTLHDERLEEQFGFGTWYTYKALQDLGLAASLALRRRREAQGSSLAAFRTRPRLWVKVAHARSLRALQDAAFCDILDSLPRLQPDGSSAQAGSLAGNQLRAARPAAQQLVVWATYFVNGEGVDRTISAPSIARTAAAQGQPPSSPWLLTGSGEAVFSSGGTGPLADALQRQDVDTPAVVAATPPLRAIFVEHDRSQHAERKALLAIARLISRHEVKAAQEAQIREEAEAFQLGVDAGGNEARSGAAAVARPSKASGEVRLFGTHTPCISCMAVFCQFQAAFPGVKLRVEFTEWRETRKALAKSQSSGALSAKPRQSMPMDEKKGRVRRVSRIASVGQRSSFMPGRAVRIHSRSRHHGHAARISAKTRPSMSMDENKCRFRGVSRIASVGQRSSFMLGRSSARRHDGRRRLGQAAR
mmetsp:Transcript_67421/g.217754  ORF Transcript_67421/g.217754 Transcript_67421/m.217754 type:complete len:901 (+) Transcript_67421:169-2871(+)